MRPGRARLVAASAGAAVLLVVGAPAARASGHIGIGFPDLGPGTAVAFGIIFPTEIGTFVDSAGANFVFGWSWQIPLSPDLHNRIAASVDVAPGSDQHTLRGRVGYRYGGHYAFGGLGGSFAHDGNAWSPELGVKFLHWPKESHNPDCENAFHLLVRAEIASAFDRFQGVTLLLGWNVF